MSCRNLIIAPLPVCSMLVGMCDDARSSKIFVSAHLYVQLYVVEMELFSKRLCSVFIVRIGFCLCCLLHDRAVWLKTRSR